MSRVGVALEGARTAYGLSLLTRHSTLDRLIGGRLVLQGAGTIGLSGDGAGSASGGEVVHACGGVVDLLHAVSMVGLAAVSPSRRRHALHAALSATGFAAAEALVCALPTLTHRP